MGHHNGVAALGGLRRGVTVLKPILGSAHSTGSSPEPWDAKEGGRDGPFLLANILPKGILLLLRLEELCRSAEAQQRLQERVVSAAQRHAC